MGDEEIELNTRQTAWIPESGAAKMGHATLTNERLLFFQQKFMAGVAGGALGAAISESLARRSDAGGPLLVVSLDSIRRVQREKKLLGKDRIVLTTDTGSYTFSDGWKVWSPLLREALAARFGRTVVDDGADAFTVEPG
ncbi:MAG TPA: hypothetical protein VGN35_02240 [Jatrophihabitantaceae bacterium]|jgi:hypothetical protein|nr:hypothetical protein [Jatrophihabitantaceae bacterium]